MGSEWREMNFGDCAELVRDTCQPDESFGKPYIGLEHIEQGTLRLNSIGIAEDVTSTKSYFKSGDILFGKLRPYFRKVVLTKFYGICSTDIWVVRSKKGVDQGYLFYWMASKEFVDIANQGSEGTKMPRARWDFVTKIKQKLPPLPEQRAIAHILGTLDDKIELNRQINETLEAIARALFKSWFIDFDPVRAKLDGRWCRGESLPGLPAHLYDLFPARLVNSELGEIPEGWRVETLGDILAEIVSGGRPKGGAVEEGVPSVGAENVIGLGKYDFSKEKYVPCDFFDQLRRRGAAVKPGDVLLYKDGAHIGRKTYFDCGFPHTECAINEHVLIIRGKRSDQQRFLFFWLDQDWMTQEIISLNSNSAQPGINQQGVRSLPILVPSDRVVVVFDQLLKPLTQRLFKSCHESRTLASIRDALLPKLLSGKIRVKDAERFLKERGL